MCCGNLHTCEDAVKPTHVPAPLTEAMMLKEQADWAQWLEDTLHLYPPDAT